MSLARDLLDQAKALAMREPKRPKQASLRRAVSTAYYAIFHLLLSDSVSTTIKAASMREYVRRIAEHSAMKNSCQRWAKGSLSDAVSKLTTLPIEKEIRDIAAVFVDAQEARHRADYDTSKPLQRIEVQSLIARVDKAFSDWAKVRRRQNALVFMITLLFEKGNKSS